MPWYDPNKKMTKMLEAALAKSAPGVNLSTNHVYTFEALLVAADAFKRAGSTDPKALADAIRKTNIDRQRQHRPGHPFDEKGQNVQLKNSAIQNRDGKLVTVAPKGAANAKAELADAALRQARLNVRKRLTLRPCGRSDAAVRFDRCRQKSISMSQSAGC